MSQPKPPVAEKLVCSCGAVLAQPAWLGPAPVRVIEHGCPQCAAKAAAEQARRAGIAAIRPEDV